MQIWRQSPQGPLSGGVKPLSDIAWYSCMLMASDLRFIPGCLQVGPKRRRLQEDNDILGPVQQQEVQEATLVQRLSEYVERIDTDMVTPKVP